MLFPIFATKQYCYLTKKTDRILLLRVENVWGILECVVALLNNVLWFFGKFMHIGRGDSLFSDTSGNTSIFRLDENP